MTPAVLDIIVAIIILLSVAIAFYRGIIREIFTIVGLGASVIGAWKGGPLLIPLFNDLLGVKADGGEKAAEAVSKGASADALSAKGMLATLHKGDLILGVISPATAAKFAAYGSTFIIIFLIMSLISFFLSRGVQEAGLGFVDRIAGAGFGFARGFLLVFLPYVLCTFLIDQNKFPDWAKNSMTVPALQTAFDYADQHFDLKKRIEDRGGSIALKIQKINPDTVGKDVSKEEDELKNELSSEDKQKAPGSP